MDRKPLFAEVKLMNKGQRSLMTCQPVTLYILVIKLLALIIFFYGKFDNFGDLKRVL